MTYRHLPKQFYRKGNIADDKKKGIRMMIHYNQIEEYLETVFIYQVDYDGHIHYVVFEARYMETAKGAFCMYPDDSDFGNDRAFNCPTLELAKAKFKELVKTL